MRLTLYIGVRIDMFTNTHFFEEGRNVTMNDISPWIVMLLGMGTVFVGLVSLILLTKLMSALIQKFGIKAKPQAPAPAAVSAVRPGPTPVAAPPSLMFKDRKQLSAIIAAAIASYLDKPLAGLRIRSIKALTGETTFHMFKDRKQFSAVIAAAVASYLDVPVAGLRICSIKLISGGQAAPDRAHGQLVAAVSAAIASSLEKEPQGLRIHSIKPC
jgi:sodium pump decarboxylase gamma subunit